MSIDNLEERLAAMQPHFDQASTDTGPGSLPPDGDYQALVKRFDFFEAKSSGQAFLKTELEIVHDRDYAGREAEVVHNLEDPDRINWLKRHLSTLGADVEGLDLRQVRPGSQLLEALLDTPVEITIKTSDRRDKDGNPYRNVYVNRKLGEPITDVPVTADPVPAGAATDPDKIPF